MRLRLLGGFDLRRDGQPVPLTPAGERLVAFLALNRRRLARVHVSGKLWPDVGEQRSLGNLRSALWRLRSADVVEVTLGRLSLAAAVAADVEPLVAAAHAVSDAPARPGGDDPVAALRGLLTGDLLPDWSDEWVVSERERLRGLRVHALELLVGRFLAERRFALARAGALAVVQAEPFRESGQRLLVAVGLAGADPARVRRHDEELRAVLRAELGTADSGAAEHLAAPDRP